MTEIERGHKTLGDLIAWLESQPTDRVVRHGFGAPHSDRGDYSNVAFDPESKTTIGAMLEHARAALGQTFHGWKGGEYTMNEYTTTHIGEYGRCGEPITAMNFIVWSARAESD